MHCNLLHIQHIDQHGGQLMEVINGILHSAVLGPMPLEP